MVLHHILHRVPRVIEVHCHRLYGRYPAQHHGLFGQTPGKGRLLCRKVDVFMANVPAVLALQPLHRHPQHHRLATHWHGVEVAAHNAFPDYILAFAVCTIKHAFLRSYEQYNGLRPVFGTRAYLLPHSMLMVQITRVHLLSVLFVHYQNVDEPFLYISPTQFCEDPFF